GLLGACAQRPAAKPSLPRTVAAGAATAPAPAPDAGTVLDAGVATDAALVESTADESRFHGALAVADRLLDGDLTRAEQRCSGRPASEREACVDALLKKKNQDLAAKADRGLSSLAALQRAGEAACAHVAKSKHEACVLGAMEKRLRQL